MKDPNKSMTPLNHWPMTCPSTNIKLLSGIMATKMSSGINQNMNADETGVGNNTRGVITLKYHLLVDRAVYTESNTNMSTIRIDFMKSHNSVPLTWMLELLKTFIYISVGLWKTTLVANFKTAAQVTIKCSIYEGDALSPLVFYTGLNPLSQVTAKHRYESVFMSEMIICHILYMNDIKLHARSELALIYLTGIYIEYIKMSVKLDKCGLMVEDRESIFICRGLTSNRKREYDH